MGQKIIRESSRSYAHNPRRLLRSLDSCSYFDPRLPFKFGSVKTCDLSVAAELWLCAADQPARMLLSRAVRVRRDMLNWRDHRLPGLDLRLGVPAGTGPAASSNVRVMLPAADVGLR